MASVAQQSNRVDKMFGFVKELVANKTADFSTEERSFLLSTFKSMVRRDRNALKIVFDISESDRFAGY